MGKVIHIYTAPTRGAAIVARAVVTALANQGLVGDRYEMPKNRRGVDYQLTLIELENIEAYVKEVDGAFTPDIPRRNIVTRGIALNDLCGKTFRVFELERLDGVKWQQGCLAQDAVGDWWLCLPVLVPVEQTVAPHEEVGIDLGLKDVAIASDGDRCAAGRFYRGIEHRIAQAQRHGHQRQAKRLHRRAANRRKDALHKFSRRMVDRYQKIVVGDVSSAQLAQTRMAKAVLDSGWGMLRRMLQYRGEHAGRSVKVVCENYTSCACSSCGSLTGPRGANGLRVRRWTCVDCGESHDRDVNAARNILRRAEASASMSGNEFRPCERCRAEHPAPRGGDRKSKGGDTSIGM